MHRPERVLTSLEAGFPEGLLPEPFVSLRGKSCCVEPASLPLPYEDAQFDVVMLDGGFVSAESVREAHRVLKSSGHLYFIVNERTRREEGFTPDELYHRLVKHGFDVVSLDRSPWWRMFFGRRTLTVCLGKKTWKEHRRLSCAGSLPFAFGNRNSQ